MSSVSIPTDFGTGNSGLTPSGQGTPTLADALRAAADDHAGLQPVDVTDAVPGAIAAADAANPAGSAVTAIATADGSDAATTQALANATKANVNLLNARVEAINTSVQGLVTLANELKAKAAVARTLLTSLKSSLHGAASYAIKLLKG